MKITRPKATREYIPRIPAVDAAIEKARARYQELACGHYTDYNRDVFWEAFRVLEKLGPLYHFCENCGQWRKLKPPPPKTILPDEPLF